MTKRRRLSTRDRAALFERDNGKCHMCGLRIEAGKKWDASHRIPLACGGADDMSNLSPAHKRCHRRHTSKVDQPWIAKVRHQRDAHTGAKVSKTSMQSSSTLPPASPAHRATTPPTKCVPRKPLYEES